MKFIDEWHGAPCTEEEFYEKVMSHVLKVFNKDTEVFAYNHHFETNGDIFDDDSMKKVFADFISSEHDENSKKVFIVNHGWHHNGERYGICKFADSLSIANNDTCPFDFEIAKANNEVVVKSKDGQPMMSLRKMEEGYIVIYVLWDAFHLNNISIKSENVMKTFVSEITEIAIRSKCSIFDKELFKVEDEGKGTSDTRFISIKGKAMKVIGDRTVDSIINEMIEKAPVKDIVLFLNQIAACPNTVNRKTTSKPIFVDKKLVNKWLYDWAINKWPYYVLFDYNFEITRPISFKLDEQKDGVLINGILNDFKSKFIKYAPILDMFDCSEFISNRVSCGHSKLTKYVPVKEGEKLSKYLSTFFGDEKFDVELSKIIQGSEFNGLCHISINPMDYMTSSINKHNWHSCHSMIDGMCGAGCASYMFDSSTLVAFVASERTYFYDPANNGKPFSWNSKSWRQLIFGNYDENMFVFAREYPADYFNDSITGAVRDILEKKVSEFCDIPDVWVKKKNGAANNNSIYRNKKGSAHYDDIPSRTTYLIRHKNNKDNATPIIIGGPVKCPVTGVKVDYSVSGTDKRCIFSKEALAGNKSV